MEGHSAVDGRPRANGVPTLLEVLVGTEEEWPDLLHLLAGIPELQQVPGGVRRWMPDFLARLSRLIDGAIKESLRTPLSEVLARGWSTYRDLRKYRDEKKYPPGTTHHAFLGKRAIRSVHKPQIEILVNGTRHVTLDCEVELALVFDVVELVIRDGRIYGIGPGQCKAEGTLSCQRIKLLPLRSRNVQLLKPCPLPEGIPIP